MYYNNLEDECSDIKHLIKRNMRDDEDRKKDIIIFTEDECKEILRMIEKVEDEYTDMANELDCKESEISDLEDEIDSLKYHEDVPEELARLLDHGDLDLGTVQILEESISNILKARGYNI